MTKRKPTPQPPIQTAPATEVLQINAKDYGLTKAENHSQVRAALAGAVIGGTTQKAYSCFRDEIELSDMLVEMRKAGDEAVKGDLSRVERMLMNQALTLDTIFNNMAQRALKQEFIKNMDTFLRLALKAQSQARATAETLSIVKNPMPYIKQANIAQGHQQVNNGNPAARTGAESPIQQTKILEAQHGEWLDTGAQGKASGANPQLATVEAHDRPQD